MNEYLKRLIVYVTNKETNTSPCECIARNANLYPDVSPSNKNDVTIIILIRDLNLK